MAVYSEDDVRDWDKEYRERACRWCWGHDFSNCDYCALFHGKTKKSNDNVPRLEGE